MEKTQLSLGLQENVLSKCTDEKWSGELSVRVTSDFIKGVGVTSSALTLSIYSQVQTGHVIAKGIIVKTSRSCPSRAC